MFNPFLRETKRAEDIFAVWTAAADDTRMAWDKWLASAGEDRGTAYVTYQACLDREERAATALAAAVGETGAPAVGWAPGQTTRGLTGDLP